MYSDVCNEINGNMKNYFLDDIVIKSGGINILPLVHSTGSKSGTNIIKAQEITSRTCKYFKEELIYTSYGKPSYKKTIVELSSDPANMPMIFIFNNTIN